PLFSLDLNTPFPLACVLRWDGERATVEGRIPVYSTLFSCFWMGGLLFIVSRAKFTEGVGGVLAGLLVLVVGAGIMVGFWVSSIRFEIRRAERILSEYEAQFAESRPSGPQRVDQFGQIHRTGDFREPGQSV